MAFQVTDDILDFVASEEILGKPVGSDIRQGVITLPALYALEHSPERAELARLLASPAACADQAEKIIHMICESDGIDYAYYVSNKFAQRALQQLRELPDRPVKESLFEIASYVSAREF
jgi:heptaprenyl diphosphate synthase